DDYNVFSVDWKDGASNVFYAPSAANTDTVGAEIYLFLQFLNSQVGHSPNNIHLIGYSLGAQCAGAAGKRNPAIARITGLDPASPSFESKGNNDKLDASDAQFVDVIHTDGDTFTGAGGYGCWAPNGHVDFYPNGGQDQPGCINVNTAGEQKGNLSIRKEMDASGNAGMGCDHGRAPDYWVESIGTACKFNSCPCTLGDVCTCSSGYNRMGFHASKSPSGIFYLVTSNTSPYCL
ncbi:pancreatic triacylglycerol lipase-like, partial [Saccoglossus kowalevskii]|uniref:Pancreatic triacylglycerol lipase-like n=1 Tax=Saccoglossus kowalevskii TaxID=10224 RepID=A0ABM0N0U3_SACKO